MKKVIALINHYERELSGLYRIDNLLEVEEFCELNNDYSYCIKTINEDLELLQKIIKGDNVNSL